MYKIWRRIVVLFLSGLLVGCSAARAAEVAGPAPVTETGTTPRTISVSGTGQVYLTPDMATIMIGVQTEHKNASRAVEENNRQASQIIQTVRDFGVAARDIRTTDFSITPSYDYGPNGERLGVRYVVNNTVLVTIRSLDTIGDLLDAVVQAGANQIHGIQFDVSDRTAALAEARQAAVADARTQAEQLAQAAGVHLGDVLSITTSVSGGTPVYRTTALMEAASVPVEAGQLAITVTVQMVYEIAP